MKIRIGNDFKTKWAITWLGEPEDFSDATDMSLFFNIYDKKIELTKDVDYTITDNIIEIDVTPDICNILGIYNLELHYTKPNDDFIDGERRSAVDIDAFRIVGKSEKADATQDVSIISDAVAIFLDIAYKKLEEIEANEAIRITNEGKREDAEDIRVENENIRISNEQDRQINTTTAINDAEQATLNANSSAVYANEQGSYAEEMSSHPPTIINDYWHIWNLTTNQYESTGQYARGDSAIDGALVVQEKGQSAVDTMSQKAVTDELLQLAGDVNEIKAILPTRLNINENTVTPDAFPSKSDTSNSFGITISQDIESPVKDLIGYKRVFLTNLQVGTGSAYNMWTIPLGGNRPPEISIAYWTKKSEFKAIYTSVFNSYLDYYVFKINPSTAFDGTPVISNGTIPSSSAAISAAKLEFSVIAEVGDYVRVRHHYYDITWKSTFVATSMPFFWLFNDASANGKPLTFIDFTCIFNYKITGSTVYPDSNTVTGSQTLNGVYVLSTNNLNKINDNTDRITQLEAKKSEVGVRIKKVGNTIHIATRFSETHDLVKRMEVIRASSFLNNPVANFISDILCIKDGDPTIVSSYIKYCNDDITPARVAETYVGGNHSWTQAYKVTMTAHGKTLADVGSVYQDSASRKFVILRILDSANMWMVSHNQATDGYTYSFVRPEGTLTYVSDGTNTANIVIATSAGAGNTYTTVSEAKVKILLDDITEITDDGMYYGKYIDVVESYDVLDLPSIIERLTANRPSGGYTVQPMLNELVGTQPMFNHSIVYRFDKRGNTLVSTTFRAYKKLNMYFHGFIQSEAFSAGNLYCPKTLPISDGVKTYDLRQINDWTAAPAAGLNLTPTYWENPLSPPDRIINMNSTANLMLGYITDRGIQLNRKENINDSMYLWTTRKIYPMGISKPSAAPIEANSFYSTVAYRSYSNPANNPVGRTNLSIIEVSGDIFIFLDYHGSLNDLIEIENDWIGRKIEVYENNNKCTLIGDVVTGDIEIISTATPTEYGFIVLKIKQFN